MPPVIGSEPRELPDKCRSWKRTFYVLFFAQMISSIGFSSCYPFIPLYVKSLGGVSSLSLDVLAGLAFSGHALTMMITSPVWGVLADRWGRKRMVIRALFCSAVTLFAMSMANSAEGFVLIRMVQGATAGVMGAVNAMVASTVPRHRVGFAMGLMQVAIGLGLGLGPLVGGVVADVYSYQVAFQVTGVQVTAACLIVMVGSTEQEERNQHKCENSAVISENLKPDIFSLPIGFIFILRFINEASRAAFIPTLPIFAYSIMGQQANINSFTGLLFGFSSGATVVFSVLLGRLADQINRYGVLMSCLLLSSVCFALQCMVNEPSQLLILQVIYGAALGGIVTSVSALLASCSEHGNEGYVYGVDNSVQSCARMIGPMMGVGVLSLFGIRPVFTVIAALYISAAVLTFYFFSSNKISD